MFSLAPLSVAFLGLAASSGDSLHCEMHEVDVSQPIASSDGVTRILYVNPCVGGCTVSSGPNDSLANTSSLVEGPSATLAEFPHGEAAWAEMVACVTEIFAPYNINVTDMDPGDQPHFENMVAGYNSDLGRPGSAGVAPHACDGVADAISFTFAYEISPSGQALCEVVAHEAGHTFGLEHAYLCPDPMTYLDGCGAKTFQDEDTECGTDAPGPCACGATQNSHRQLLSVFGAGDNPAELEVTLGEVIEDPAASNGNGILEPGERASISLSLYNGGNAPAAGASVEISSKGLGGPTDENLPIVPAGFTVTHQVSAEVEAQACGRETALEVTTVIGNSRSTAATTILPGIARSERVEAFATEAAWTVVDESSQGAWEFGVPEQVFFAGRTLQPAQGPGGNGDSAWFTGLGPDWDQSALEGRASLSSPSLDLSEWHAVTAVRMNLWYMAFARPNGGLEPSPDAHLLIELSNDDGQTWTEGARVISDPLRWEELEVPIAAGFEPSATTRVRVVAVNEAGIDDRLVEVGIDSVVLVGGELLCSPTQAPGEGGGGCSTSGGQNRGNLGAILLGLAFFGWRRRARRE